MKVSQFAGATAVLRNGDPIEELRLGGQLALSSSTGEINAHDKKELVHRISQLLGATESGDIRTGSVSVSSAQVQAKRREVLAAAYADNSKWVSLGANMAMQVEQQRNRDGIMRRVSVGSTLGQGEIARVNMKTWDAVAMVATSSVDVAPQLVRSKRFFPAEFEITANLRVEQIEIEQVSNDVLDHAYNEGLDATMVAEDRLWKKAADATVGVVNPLEYITGQLTPRTLAAIRDSVTDWNLPARSAIIANDYWKDIIGNAEFSALFDPISKYDLVMNGHLGTLVGLELITDGFRQHNQRVLQRGDLYVVADPEYHAAYTDRGGIRSTPTSGADQGNTSKGWLLSEILSFVLANPRSVSKGKRF